MLLDQNLVVKLSTISFELIHVQGGTFQMGSKENQAEQPVHPVTLPSFYIGQYLVTQDLYIALKKENPSYFKGESRPVENVSWKDAIEFIDLLNELPSVQNLKGEFRLPTESEWEYAAIGGSYSQGYEYCGSDDLKQVGWYDENSGGETKSVGLLQPNELGLYDMSGNIYEWCEDDYHNSYKNAPDDGSAWIDAPSRGASRVVRGGSYFYNPVYCRPAARNRDSPGFRYDDIGFRLVFSPQLQGSSSDRP